MFVKGNLGLPTGFIEKTDTELTNWIKTFTLPVFSEYFPDNEYTSVIVENTNYKHDVRNNWFYFFDEEDLDIFGIKDVFFSLSESVSLYHPIPGPITFEGMKWWSLDVFKSRFFQSYTDYNYSYKFREPNIVEILPTPRDNFVVWYEREQPDDLRKIPTSRKNWFLQLALADLKIYLGSIRSNYGDGIIDTPFGSIPLKGDILKSDGESARSALLELFVSETMPSVTLSIG